MLPFPAFLNPLIGPHGPIDVLPVSNNGTVGGTGVVDPPTYTPITPGAWVVAVAGATRATNNLTNHFANPSGFDSGTNKFRDAYRNATVDTECATAIKSDWTSGAYDPASMGGNSVASASAGVTYAIRPESTISFLGSDAFISSGASWTRAFSNLKDSSNNTPTLQEWDLIILHFAQASSGAGDGPAAAGYTEFMIADKGIPGSSGCYLRGFWKFMGPTPDTDINFQGQQGGTSFGVAANIYAYRGAFRH